MYNAPVYIYALINPITNQVFYIGATKYPKERLSNHLSGKKTTTKGIEIDKILSMGRVPEMQTTVKPKPIGNTPTTSS